MFKKDDKKIKKEKEEKYPKSGPPEKIPATPEEVKPFLKKEIKKEEGPES